MSVAEKLAGTASSLFIPRSRRACRWFRLSVPSPSLTGGAFLIPPEPTAMMLANALALGVVRPGGGGASPYDPSAEALFARMTVQPTTERKELINELIVALKAANVWSLMDVLYVRAAHDGQAARLNWIADQYNSTAISSPVFTADRGYTPDGSASYLTSGFNPVVVVGSKGSQDNAHMGGWHLTDLPNGAGLSADLGNTNSRISNSGASVTGLRANSTVNATNADDYAAHKVWTRSGASAWRYFYNGTLVGADPRTDASAPFVSYDFGTGRTANTNFGLNQEAISHWGADLSAAQVLSTRNAFATYLSAVGAI